MPALLHACSRQFSASTPGLPELRFPKGRRHFLGLRQAAAYGAVTRFQSPLTVWLGARGSFTTRAQHHTQPWSHPWPLAFGEQLTSLGSVSCLSDGSSNRAELTPVWRTRYYDSRAGKGDLQPARLPSLWMLRCWVTDCNWGLCRTRFQNASQRAPPAPEHRRLPPPGSPPDPPARRAPAHPSPAGSPGSRAQLPPHAGIPRSPGRPGRRSSSTSSPGREPRRPQGASGLREVRECRDYGSPGPGARPTHRPRGRPQRLLLFHVVPQRLAQVLLGRLQLAHKGRHCSARLSRPTVDRTATATSNRKINPAAEGLRSGLGRLGSARLVGPAPCRSGETLRLFGSRPRPSYSVGRAPGPDSVR